MARLIWTTRFGKAYDALGTQQKRHAQRAMERFIENPRHPGLHFEKIAEGHHTIRAGLNFRILLRHEGGETYSLIDVGSHTYIYDRSR